MMGQVDAVPMAAGAMSPVWPLPAVGRRSYNFGASRAGGQRHHAGVDLYAPRGSVILAPEDGTVIATQPFNGPNAVALLLETDTGAVILLGEIEPGSWRIYGVDVGVRVEAGDRVANVGINPGGSTMLHFEMYAPGTRRNHRWFQGSAPPPSLLNPTSYLQSAAALDADQSDLDIDEDGDDDDHDQVDPGTTIPDTIPGTPQTQAGSGIAPLAIVLGLIFMLDDV